MTSALSLPSVRGSLILWAVLSTLAGCGANTNDSSPAVAMVSVPNVSAAKAEVKTDQVAGVATAFIPALGSSGNGMVMTELKNHRGQLREPDAKYDVYDTDTTADLKTLKQSIQVSLDRGNQVLIDSDGTPESRANAAEILKNAVGASLPDSTAVLVRKVAEENGGGLGLIPIYTRAEVAEQIAQGKINKPEELNNSVENFFFEPKEK